MENAKANKSNLKKNYESPIARFVELRLEERLLSCCKESSSSGQCASGRYTLFAS